MASIISGSIDLTKIDKSKIYEGKKGKYYPVTVVLNNELGNYGDSGYIQTEQTKEERDAKQPKTFLGNVKVVWTDGQNVTTAQKDGQQVTTMEPTPSAAEPDLPF
jgi:hypothetical protein|tara:strand:+ start:236 stop:550 length:315 start_codon:yes stop_codon:yes gene_type:complete